MSAKIQEDTEYRFSPEVVEYMENYVQEQLRYTSLARQLFPLPQEGVDILQQIVRYWTRDGEFPVVTGMDPVSVPYGSTTKQLKREDIPVHSTGLAFPAFEFERMSRDNVNSYDAQFMDASIDLGIKETLDVFTGNSKLSIPALTDSSVATQYSSLSFDTYANAHDTFLDLWNTFKAGLKHQILGDIFVVVNPTMKITMDKLYNTNTDLTFTEWLSRWSSRPENPTINFIEHPFLGATAVEDRNRLGYSTITENTNGCFFLYERHERNQKFFPSEIDIRSKGDELDGVKTHMHIRSRLVQRRTAGHYYDPDVALPA